MATEAEIGAANARALGDDKTYATISIIGFAFVAILSLILGVIISIIPFAFILMGILFFYADRKVGREGTGSGTAYLFIFTSTIFLGSVTGFLGGLVGEFGVGGVVGGLAGAVFAFFKLQSKGMI